MITQWYLRSAGVELGPGRDELAQVVGPEDGGVTGQVVKVVHDDRHKEVQHDEAAEEDEGDKVDVGHVRPAGLIRVQQLP
jgi:hypothetical protein